MKANPDSQATLRGSLVSQHLQFNTIMRLEKINRDFQQLPFMRCEIEELPRINSGIDNRVHWSNYYTAREFEYVRTWAGCDFERYGYPVDPFDDSNLPLQTVPKDRRPID